MPATDYPFHMIGGVPVVTAPAEIDITTAGELRAILLEWHSQGHTTVVVDLTGTRFCDSAGLQELGQAHRRAAADGGGLRLVTRPDGAFMRIFTITGLDGIIPHYPTVEQALAQIPAAVIRPLRRGTARKPAAAPVSPPARIPDDGGPAGDSRRCEQCGAVFVPAREHARFCTGHCRAAWNRDHLTDPVVEASALTWSMAAMSEATARLPAVQDQTQGFAAIGEAVWWITMVDATLVRRHLQVYEAVLAGHAMAKRRVISETLAGLRFVRNWISRAAGPGEVIETGTGTRPVTGWTWKPVPEPALAWLPPRAQAWERARYRAYDARLAGCTIGETFGQAVTFLALTSSMAAASSPDTSQHAGRSSRKGVDQAGATVQGEEATR